MKAIMIQGTMSNSGKSFITAALCRIFTQDGYSVAPFKSQNMALNSYITEDGLEIGRAQAMQAEACKKKPSVYMNPILLKPNSHTGSQVIVSGKVVGNMNARDYFKNKKKLIPDILDAYNTLKKDNDIIVIEGAGSPAEINLKSDDIVNMGLARLVKAPVLLVGDIDRGGVFASLYGTVKLLEKEEARLIKGMIINKFRGDVEILKPGLRMIEDKLGIGVLGTIPMEYIDIDDEDSLSERLNKRIIKTGIDIAVIRLPHISNFTDFNILDRIAGASLRYVEKGSDFGNPDLIIIPGTKNTMYDLAWLRQTGIFSLIMKAYDNDAMVFGICGGLQILGKEIYDPDNMEFGGYMQGLGLLDIKTEFRKIKQTKQVEGELLSSSSIFKGISDKAIKGYEIHMGETGENSEIERLFLLSDGRYEGYLSEDGRVFATYLHGVFDNIEFTMNILKFIAAKKNVELKDMSIDLETYKNEQYDKLADLVRNNIDMDKIYKILREGV